MTEADVDALYDAMAGVDIAHEQDPAWLAKSKRWQEAARASVEAEDELREPTVPQKVAAFATGAGESASLGLSPYLYGAMRAMDPFVRPGEKGFLVEKPIAGIPERFREGVEAQKEARESMSTGKIGASYGAGYLASDLANAALGVAPAAKSALVAAKSIAGGAPASSVLSTGIRPAVEGVKRGASALLKKAGERADEARVLTTMNNPGVLREAERFPGGVPALAEKLRETGVSRGITTTSGIARRAKALQESSGAVIGDMIARATKKGGVVDAKQLSAELRRAATEASSGLQTMLGDPKVQTAYLRDLADQLDALAPKGIVSLQDVKDLSVGTGRQAASAYKRIATDKDVPGQGLALMDARRAYENAIARGIGETGVADKAAIDAAKSDYQAALIAGEAAETSLGRSARGGPLGLVTATLGAQNPLAAVTYGALKPIYASGRATAMEAARELGQKIAPAITAEQAANVQRALAAGNDPAAVSAALGVPISEVEMLAQNVAVAPASVASLGGALVKKGQQQRPQPRQMQSTLR